jgi:hypothetical protein
MNHARLGAAVVAIALPLAALAQTAPEPPSPTLVAARAKMRAACAGDVQKFCAEVQRGNGGLQSCMREHRAELSAECQSARADPRAVRRKEKG